MSTIRADIKSRPARWGIVVVVLLLMVDALSVVAWMRFPSFKAGAVAVSTSSATAEMPSLEVVRLADKLRSSGVELSFANGSKVQREPFSVPAALLTLNGDNIQVFEYADRATASREAEKFLGAYPKTSSQIAWSPAAHSLYAEGSLLILYTGTRSEIVSLLNKTLGAPFDLRPR